MLDVLIQESSEDVHREANLGTETVLSVRELKSPRGRIVARLSVHSGALRPSYPKAPQRAHVGVLEDR